MDNFESRDIRVERDDQTIYQFISDVRNFKQFIPGDSVKNWQATNDSCSFEIPFAGKTGFAIVHKTPFSEVKYSGKALNDNEITFDIRIFKKADNLSSVKVLIEASLNPMLKMMVKKPLLQFLDKMANEIEKFDGWENTTV